MLDTPDFPLGLFYAMLFMQIGPIGLIPLFAAVTRDEPPAMRVKIAFLSAAISFGTLLLAVFLAVPVMNSWGIRPPTLIIAAGLVLTLTSLRSLFFQPPPVHAARAGLGKALTPLAIPGIVSPVAVAIIAIFVAYYPGVLERRAIMAALATIFAVDIVAMILADRFMRHIGMAPLIILGAIFGILQVALGIEVFSKGVMRLIAGH